MRLLGAHRGQAVLACLTLGVGLMAAVYDGVPTSEVDLNDGGVWVTNLESRAVAHLSYPSRTLDAAMTASSADFDVLQHGTTVAVEDRGSGTLSPVDSTVPSLGSAAAVPPGFLIGQGGGTVIVSDPVGGEVWAMDAAEVDGFSEDREPTLTGTAGGSVAVGTDGTAYVVAASGRLTSVAAATGEGWTTTALGSFGRLPSGEVELSVVGSTPVLLDRRAGEVRTLEETVAVEAADELVLQAPGDDGDDVALAAPDHLLLVPLDGGDVRVVGDAPDGPGDAAAPVRRGTCTYAAWGGTGHYQRVCDDSTQDEAEDVERLARTSSPVFRVNRDVVVLNSTDNGDTFLPDDDMTLVANWDDVLGHLEDQEEKKEESDEQDQRSLADRTEQNHTPKAHPDSYGVRPGRSTTLPVLDNDTDQDGDVLTASAEESPRVGTVLPVRGGEALQVVAPPGAAGADTFTYAASDGRGEPGTSQVQVEVHPWSVNGAPEPKDRDSVVVVGSGAEVTYDVLQDWIDPDGDPVYLESVQGTDDIAVRSKEDGTVTITDLGRAEPGLHQVEVRVSDGREVASGTLDVDLRSDANVAPVANADHVLAVAGEETTVDPLANDTDANGDDLRLAQVVSPGGGARVILDPASGTFAFLARRAGTVYVEYTVSDGPAVSTNVVRVDVVDGTAGDEPPVADNDLALLPAGQSVLVPVLANDYDPAGGVLVVQSVSAPPEAGLQLDIVNHELVRVRAVGSLRAPVAFTYTISNGAAPATAQVTVVNVPDPGSDKAPVVEDDSATVRAGDIVTIPALANDRSPADLELRIADRLPMLPKDFPGTAFVSGRDVRFKAGSEPGRVRLTYTVFDSAENYTSGTIVVTVVPEDAPNTPPTPRPLVARVLAGGSVTIPVPTDGVDPEGDSVTLLGVARPAPTKGVVSVVGGSLKYVAPVSASGTDAFRYLVEDASGAQATGSVRVGIAPPSATNQLPTAVTDVVKVRPGRKLAVPVTANDTDPDGDTPLLVPDSVTPASKATTVAARTDGSRVLLTTPRKNADLDYYYRITDAPGGQRVDGVLTVQVREKAPLRAPIARDDVVTAAETLGRNTATVDVLANDSDPDGVAEDLVVSSEDRGVSVSGGTLEVALDKARRVVLYTVTDVDGLTSRAVVTVPGTADLRPVIDPGAAQVKVTAGTTVEIALADHVVVRSGRAPSLTFGNTVQAGPGGVAKAVSQKVVSFTADRSFSGPSAVTFEVTDGTDADDASGLVATLSVPIEVLPATKEDDDEDDPERTQTPPRFTPTELTVAPGDDAVEADLRAMVTDPDPGDVDKLRFSLGKVSGDTGRVKVTLSGSTLRAQASADTPVGTSLIATVTVTDGSTAPVSAGVPVRVVSSTRPLIQVQPIEITDAEAGVAEVVDVADHVTNPFADDGEPVRLLSAEIAGGDASGRVTVSGTRLTITPDAATSGQLTVRFSVGDATDDPARQVDGLVRVTVRDRPDAPTGVTATSEESATVTLTWTTPANNGAQITGYEAQWSGGTQQCGQTTRCVVDGLRNGVEYTFTVTAANEVGTSDRSAASNVVTPDQRPDPPSAVTGEFGDRSASLKWTTPTGDFSAVTSYSILLSPGDAAGRTQIDGITGTSATVDNLVNGTAYTFQVLAHNAHPDPSDPSPASAPVVPAGAPFAPAAPTVQKRAPDATQPSATVSWTAPDGNGDNNLVYSLKASNGRTWDGLTGTSQEVLMDASTTAVTFTVRATNKAGTGDASPASAPQRFFQKPGPVSNLQATPNGTDDTATITFGAAAGNGATPGEITYNYRTPSRSGTLTSGQAIGGFTDGQPVTIEVWATSRVSGETAVGDARSTSANTFGTPFPPSVAASGNPDNVTLTWNAGSSANGRAITNVEIRTTDGGVQGGQGITGQAVQGNGRNQTKTIQARAFSQQGGWSDWSNVASASTWGDRWVDLRHDTTVNAPAACRTGGKRCVYIRVVAFTPGSSAYCFAGGQSAPDWFATIGVGPDGNSGWVNQGPPGYLFDTAGSAYPDGRNPPGITCQQQ